MKMCISPPLRGSAHMARCGIQPPTELPGWRGADSRRASRLSAAGAAAADVPKPASQPVLPPPRALSSSRSGRRVLAPQGRDRQAAGREAWLRSVGWT